MGIFAGRMRGVHRAPQIVLRRVRIFHGRRDRCVPSQFLTKLEISAVANEASDASVPVIMEAVAHQRVARTRPMGMAGPLAIPFSEMKAWAEITGAHPNPWEISVLERMDAAALAASAKGASVSNGEPTPIEATDAREVVGFMRQMAARKKV